MARCLSLCPLLLSLSYKHSILFKSLISLPWLLAYANREVLQSQENQFGNLKITARNDRIGLVRSTETMHLWSIWNGTGAGRLAMRTLSLAVASDKIITKDTGSDTPLWKLFLCFMKNRFCVTWLYYFTSEIH